MTEKPESAPQEWSRWHRFPDPRARETLTAPIGPGCYELRHSSNKQLILFGLGRNVAGRMTSLLPRPQGAAGRNNKTKSAYVLEHISDVEYRTFACDTREDAEAREKRLKANKSAYIFKT